MILNPVDDSEADLLREVLRVVGQVQGVVCLLYTSPTSDFLTRTLNKITLIGAIFLAAVAVLPIILGNLTGMSIQLGGTSLLIVVGVALDTTRSLDSFMTMRNHKGLDVYKRQPLRPSPRWWRGPRTCWSLRSYDSLGQARSGSQDSQAS